MIDAPTLALMKREVVAGHRYPWLALWLLGLVVAAHAFMGATALPTLAAVAVTSVGILWVWRRGFLCAGAVLIFLVSVRFAAFPLVAKLALGQPVDSNLMQAGRSFAVVLVGTAGCSLALHLALRIHVGRPILVPVRSVEQLRRLALGAFSVGVLANAAVALRVASPLPAVTVAEFFTHFLHLALIAAVAAVVVGSAGRRTWDWWVLLIAGAELLSAVVLNQRMPLVVAFLAYFFTVTAFRGGISRNQTKLVATLFILAVVFATYITPVMLSVRTDRAQLSWSQRIEATWNAATDWKATIAAYESLQRAPATGYSRLYYGTRQNVLERLSLVNQTDLLVAATDRTQHLGSSDLVEAIRRTLPRFVSSAKDVTLGHGSWVYRSVGLQAPRQSYETAPLIATGYVSYGWAGAFGYPAILGLLLLLLMKKVAGLNMAENVWAVFLFVLVQNLFVEGTTDAYLTAIFRFVPQDTLVLFVLSLLGCTSLFAFQRRFPQPRRQL